MSLEETIKIAIDSVIQNLLSFLSDDLKIEKVKLVESYSKAMKGNVLKSNVSPISLASSMTNVNTEDISPARLSKCTKIELIALCKKHSKKCTGKKEELIDRLLDKNSEVKAEKIVKIDKPIKAEKKVNVKSKKEDKDNSVVLQKIKDNIPTTAIRKNGFGNLEHPETNLVFNKVTQRVIGKQEKDGTVSDLTDEDIEKCKQFKFNYDLPKNLDTEQEEEEKPKKENLGIKDDVEEVDEVDGDIEEVEDVEEVDGSEDVEEIEDVDE